MDNKQCMDINGVMKEDKDSARAATAHPSPLTRYQRNTESKMVGEETEKGGKRWGNGREGRKSRCYQDRSREAIRDRGSNTISKIEGNSMKD